LILSHFYLKDNIFKEKAALFLQLKEANEQKTILEEENGKNALQIEIIKDLVKFEENND